MIIFARKRIEGKSFFERVSGDIEVNQCPEKIRLDNTPIYSKKGTFKSFWKKCCFILNGEIYDIDYSEFQRLKKTFRKELGCKKSYVIQEKGFNEIKAIDWVCEKK